jgi:hypothetical protein
VLIPIILSLPSLIFQAPRNIKRTKLSIDQRVMLDLIFFGDGPGHYFRLERLTTTAHRMEHFTLMLLVLMG